MLLWQRLSKCRFELLIFSRIRWDDVQNNTSPPTWVLSGLQQLTRYLLRRSHNKSEMTCFDDISTVVIHEKKTHLYAYYNVISHSISLNDLLSLTLIPKVRRIGDFNDMIRLTIEFFLLWDNTAGSIIDIVFARKIGQPQIHTCVTLNYLSVTLVLINEILLVSLGMSIDHKNAN